MQDNLADIKRRVKRYWYTDGVGELVGGGGFILLGIYFTLQELLRNSLIGTILEAGFVLLFIGGTQAGVWLTNKLKTRLTYPRTGYVEYQVDPQPSTRRPVLLVAMAVAFSISLITVGLARWLYPLAMLTVFTGLIIAGLFTILLWASGSARFLVMGCVSLGLGLALARSGLPESYSIGLLYGLMGVCLSISGGLTLWGYLRRNPMPVEEK